MNSNQMERGQSLCATYDFLGGSMLFPITLQFPFEPSTVLVVNNTDATLYLSSGAVTVAAGNHQITIPPRFAMPVLGWHNNRLAIGSDGSIILATDSLTIQITDQFWLTSPASIGGASTSPIIIRTYATWNPLDKNAGITLTGANLTATGNAGAGNCALRANMGKSNGKWYWEITVSVNAAGGQAHGVGSGTQNLNAGGAYANLEGIRVYFAINGNKYVPATPYGATYTVGDVIGCALDMDVGSFTCYKNGVNQGALITGLTGIIYPYSIPAEGSTCAANFGASAFVYTPPAGFNAGVYT